MGEGSNRGRTKKKGHQRRNNSLGRSDLSNIDSIERSGLSKNVIIITK